MNGPKLKVLVCGSTFGQFYLAALRQYPEAFEIAGLLSRGSARSKACAARLGIPCYNAVSQLPDAIDLACVVLRSAVIGGNGDELAQQLMRKGISVIQEQPVHHDGVVTNLRCARQHQVHYCVGNLYPHLPAVVAFSQHVQTLKRRQAPQFIDAACASQVAFPLVTMLAASLGQTRPWRIESTGETNLGPFQLLRGEWGGIPLTLRIHNEVDPHDPDNHLQLLHQIAIGFPAGRITLTDTQGPITWHPRLHIPQSVKRDFDFSTSEATHLMENTGEILGEGFGGSWRTALSQQWPQAIATALLDLRQTLVCQQTSTSQQTGIAQQKIAGIENERLSTFQQANPQELLTQCQIWQTLTQAVGYPHLTPGQQFQPLAFSSLLQVSTLLQQAVSPSRTDLPSFTERAEQIIADITHQEISTLIDAMDTACLNAMLFSLQQGGVLNRPEYSHDSEEILNVLAVAEQHRPLIRRWFTLLVDRGRLSLRAGRYVGTAPLAEQNVIDAWRQVHLYWDNRLGSPAFIDYLYHNAQQLLPLMRAEQQAALLLFPLGETTVADAVYRHTVTARYLNTVIADWLIERVNASATPLRVLEIGAGTGATTDHVCERLQHKSSQHKALQRNSIQRQFTDTPPIHWIFSDISSFFLVNARERYSALPWMSFKLLDIDQPLTQQGVAAQSVDVLVMAGVLNNAHNSEQTVRWLAEVLVPGGMMLITEPTREHLEILTSQAFMMTPPLDDRQRSGLRFLTPEQWRDLFQRAGLQLDYLLPTDNHRLTPLGQRLFIVQRPVLC